MFSWITDELNSVRWRRRQPRGDLKVRLGLSGFMFEESLSKERRDENSSRSNRSAR